MAQMATARSSSWIRIEGRSAAIMRQKMQSCTVLFRVVERHVMIAHAGIVSLMSTVPDVTISLVGGADNELLLTCLRTISAAAGDLSVQPAVVDNASADGLARSVGWVTGAAIMARRDALLDVGGFDERFFMYCEDADLCRQLHDSGWQVAFFPHASLLHLENAATSSVPVRRIYQTARSRGIYT